MHDPLWHSLTSWLPSFPYCDGNWKVSSVIALLCFTCLLWRGYSWTRRYCISMFLNFIETDPLSVQSSKVLLLVSNLFLRLNQPYWFASMALRCQSGINLPGYNCLSLWQPSDWAPLTTTLMLLGPTFHKSPSGLSVTHFCDLDTRNVNVDCKDHLLF